ncbi:MAG: hypothetical protein RMJ56_03415 [Gemmataceae bacterium]|nr:hypothetical protein [Gemmata sp.]MDW8196638.1 hypothetical protein [Gemmataceae bacterium]
MAVAIDKPEPVSVRPVVATKEPSIVEKVRVDLFHIGWTEQTDGPYLALFWYAQAEEGARYEYLGGWEGLHFVCRDDTGRIYPPQMVPRHPARTNRPQAVAEKIAALSAAAKARGQGFNVNPSNGLVTHNSIILDGIVIEKPAEQAQKLTVIFRGAALGVRGDFVFEIPQELWDNSIK